MLEELSSFYGNEGLGTNHLGGSYTSELYLWCIYGLYTNYVVLIIMLLLTDVIAKSTKSKKTSYKRTSRSSKKSGSKSGGQWSGSAVVWVVVPIVFVISIIIIIVIIVVAFKVYKRQQILKAKKIRLEAAKEEKRREKLEQQ